VLLNRLHSAIYALARRGTGASPVARLRALFAEEIDGYHARAMEARRPPLMR
jgi:hypothetical protein